MVDIYVKNDKVHCHIQYDAVPTDKYVSIGTYEPFDFKDIIASMVQCIIEGGVYSVHNPDYAYLFKITDVPANVNKRAYTSIVYNDGVTVFEIKVTFVE